MDKRGTCKWFNPQKGFGFITDEDGNEVFVHYSSIKMEGFRRLADGQEVIFNVEETEKGLVAVNVRVVDKSEQE